MKVCENLISMHLKEQLLFLVFSLIDLVVYKFQVPTSSNISVTVVLASKWGISSNLSHCGFWKLYVVKLKRPQKIFSSHEGT